MVNLDGCLAASPQPRIFARGFKPKDLSLASETRTTAAAPSLSGDALGAVTVPSPGLNAGLIERSLSALSWIR